MENYFPVVTYVTLVLYIYEVRHFGSLVSSAVIPNVTVVHLSHIIKSGPPMNCNCAYVY